MKKRTLVLLTKKGHKFTVDVKDIVTLKKGDEVTDVFITIKEK
jgi:hypothetical protein